MPEMTLIRVCTNALSLRQIAVRTYSTHRNLIEGMKNPRGSREGEARRFAERDFAIH